MPVRVALARGSFTVFVAALASILAGVPLAAQQTIGVKVGVFNADRVMAESQPGQQALALFNQLRDQRVGELRTQQEGMNTVQQQAMAAAPGSPEAAQLQRELEDLAVRMDRLEQDVQQELGLRQNELTEGINQMIAQIIDAMAVEEGYSLIFNGPQSGLVYGDPSLDITDEIILRVNATGAPDGP